MQQDQDSMRDDAEIQAFDSAEPRGALTGTPANETGGSYSQPVRTKFVQNQPPIIKKSENLMPYKDREKMLEYQRNYAKTHPSRDRVKAHRCNKPCNNPVTNPNKGVTNPEKNVTNPSEVISKLQEMINGVEKKVVGIRTTGVNESPVVSSVRVVYEDY